jgi:8-oxo-dGTP diphosphatase
MRERCMRHRISAGVLVEDDNRLLLVNHRKPGAYDFWVAPGGGAEDSEDLRATARREVKEECGLDVEPLAVAYIEELTSPELRICKLWFSGRIVAGSLSSSRPAAAAEHIVDAAFLSVSEFEGKTIFPPVLRDQYWRDRLTGFAVPRYLGIREMKFY